MLEKTVIKGGSKKLGNATLEDFAVLQLHSTIDENAAIRGSAVIARSTVQGNAVVEGIAQVWDAFVAGTARLTIEYVGKNGHVTDNSHVIYIKIRGIGYTVHRIYSEAKGYSAQIMTETGEKVTINNLKDLVDEFPEYKVLQYLFNQCKKNFSESD